MPLSVGAQEPRAATWGNGEKKLTASATSVMLPVASCLYLLSLCQQDARSHLYLSWFRPGNQNDELSRAVRPTAAPPLNSCEAMLKG